MERYLEIFGRKFCGKKGNFGLWRRKLFFGSGNTAYKDKHGINYFADLRMTFRQNFFLQDWFRNEFVVGLG
jgi:hypothetical protein